MIVTFCYRGGVYPCQYFDHCNEVHVSAVEVLRVAPDERLEVSGRDVPHGESVVGGPTAVMVGRPEGAGVDAPL